MKYAGVGMVILGELFCVPMTDIFVSYDSGLRSLTISGFRFFALSFVRTMIFQCAAVMLLPLVWGINGVWISVIVSEFLSVLLGVMFLITKQRKYQY